MPAAKRLENGDFHYAWAPTPSGVIANDGGRVTDSPDGAVVPGLYTAAGSVRAERDHRHQLRLRGKDGDRAASGPSGAATEARADRAGLERLLDERGAPKGKPREKFPRRAEMLAVLG